MTIGDRSQKVERDAAYLAVGIRIHVAAVAFAFNAFAKSEDVV